MTLSFLGLLVASTIAMESIQGPVVIACAARCDHGTTRDGRLVLRLQQGSDSRKVSVETFGRSHLATDSRGVCDVISRFTKTTKNDLITFEKLRVARRSTSVFGSW
ncbi:hypothetical protein AC1031_022029 [Aphanomyces cochlioides]|nr:hypothetical protein AC1031_022029 [Aphanomyces cochlioides]